MLDRRVADHFWVILIGAIVSSRWGILWWLMHRDV